MKFSHWLLSVVISYCVLSFVLCLIVAYQGVPYWYGFLLALFGMGFFIVVNLVGQFANRRRLKALNLIAKQLSLKILGDIFFFHRTFVGPVDDDDPVNQPVGFSKKIQKLPLMRNGSSTERGGLSLGYFDIILSAYNTFILPKSGTSITQRFRNVLAKETKDVSYAVFDYSYHFWTESSDDSSLVDRTVVSFCCPKLDFPAYELKPGKSPRLEETSRERACKLIDFDDSPNFTKLFTLSGQHENRVRALFQPAVLRVIEENADGANIEAEGDHIIFHYRELPTSLETYKQVLENCKTMFREFSKVAPRSRRLEEKANVSVVPEQVQAQNQQTIFDGFETPDAMRDSLKSPSASSSIGLMLPAERPVKIMYVLYERYVHGDEQSREKVEELLEKYELSDNFSLLEGTFLKTFESVSKACQQSLAHVSLEELYAEIQTLPMGENDFDLFMGSHQVKEVLKIQPGKRSAKIKVLLQDGTKQTLNLVQKNNKWYLSEKENLQAAILLVGQE